MRKCVNPDCGALWEDEDKVNPCLKCGWTTVPQEIAKKVKKDMNVTGHGD
jgi:hypothetical protein